MKNANVSQQSSFSVYFYTKFDELCQYCLITTPDSLSFPEISQEK